MAKRKIVEIDEEKCNGCGLCVPSCAEGAIQIVEGKARLVSDVYCDGLGACLGECPQGAISIVEREAGQFDQTAAHRHVAAIPSRGTTAGQSASPSHTAPSAVVGLNLLAAGGTKRTIPQAPCAPKAHGACPGTMVRSLLDTSAIGDKAPSRNAEGEADAAPSCLGNWPLQLHLVPPTAPWLQDADLLLVADCVPFALADFHTRFLRGRSVVIGCPKLDDGAAYVEKLIEILRLARPRSLTVVHMEVPCCTGLTRIAQMALQATAAQIPFEDVTVSIRGKVLRQVCPAH